MWVRLPSRQTCPGSAVDGVERGRKTPAPCQEGCCSMGSGLIAASNSTRLRIVARVAYQVLPRNRVEMRPLMQMTFVQRDGQ